MKTKLLLLLSLFLLNLHASTDLIKITYEDAKNEADQEAIDILKESKINEDFKHFVKETFKIDKQINIAYGYNEGPLYDGDTNTIAIDYAFIDEVYYRFEKKYPDQDVTDKVIDSLLHTLLHEFAHLFIYVNDLPVVGKEEDAADGLANIILLEFFENGATMTKNAGELFLMESKERPNHTKEDYWDEHSLDIQRYYATMCYIYGSNPKKYKNISKELEYDQHRKDFCEGDYANLYSSWIKILDPYLKD